MRVIRNDVATGRCVIYVMSRDQRVHDNHALLAAQAHARQLNVPLVVHFNMLERSGWRSREHFTFMLDGFAEVSVSLSRLRIPFVITHGNARQELLNVCRALQPARLYFDFSPLSGPRSLPSVIAQTMPQVFIVDTHNIVPVWETSDKQEFAAHTIRHKLHTKLEKFMVSPEAPVLQEKPNLPVYGIDVAEARSALHGIAASGIQHGFTAGETAASRQLSNFITKRLPYYAHQRNNPTVDMQSDLSPYLHFGQLSSLRVALEIQKAVGTLPLLFEEARMPIAKETPSVQAGMYALFEELIVRKELADNFCYYGPGYTTLADAPNWAVQTLADHATDPREFYYTKEQLEHAQTHDEAWNAAQLQLTKTGKMHGYMRMYWAKKILEWSQTPEDALGIAIELNDRYSLDGGDPNGYVGILWSIAGLHDRPWFERPIFGKIRYMNEAGLRRKFDIDMYMQQWLPQK